MDEIPFYYYASIIWFSENLSNLSEQNYGMKPLSWVHLLLSVSLRTSFTYSPAVKAFRLFKLVLSINFLIWPTQSSTQSAFNLFPRFMKVMTRMIITVSICNNLVWSYRWTFSLCIFVNFSVHSTLTGIASVWKMFFFSSSVTLFGKYFLNLNDKIDGWIIQSKRREFIEKWMKWWPNYHFCLAT